MANACSHLLDRHVEEGRGERIALAAAGRRVTYRELLTDTARAAAAFADRGIARGARVVLLAPDGPEFVTAFFGLLRAGVVPVPLNERLAAPEVARIVDDCRPSAAVVAPVHASRLAAAARAVPRERIWVARGGSADAPDGMRSLAADVAATRSHAPSVAVADEDVAAIVYTSGSTGAPKGAVYVHRGLRGSRAGCFAEPHALSRDDACFATASLSFAYGLYALLHTLAVGATAILDDGPRMPHLVLECVRRRSPTVLFSTPRLYADVVALAEEHADVELPRLRVCVSSGEALPAALHDRWRRRFGLDLLDVVGATETLRPFLVPDPARGRPEPGRWPAPGCELELRDERGRPVPEAQPGRLRVRTACNAARYWENERETAATNAGGWVETGDVAIRERSGEYVFLGRADGVAKVRGQRVVAGEVERCLSELGVVRDCALVIATGADELATTVAFVDAGREGAGDAALAQALRRHCRSRLAPHKVPARVVLVDALPRTANGKVARGALREQADELMRPPAPAPEPGMVGDVR